MILFFDRNVGTSLPQALRSLNLPAQVEWHQQHFPQDAPDDQWLPVVGTWGWTVIGYDQRFHRNEAERNALKQYGVGCFYLWGGDKSGWERMRFFLNVFEKIQRADTVTARPFLFKIEGTGQVRRIAL